MGKMIQSILIQLHFPLLCCLDIISTLYYCSVINLCAYVYDVWMGVRVWGLESGWVRGVRGRTVIAAQFTFTGNPRYMLGFFS